MANWLRKYREAAGLTQAALAARVGASRQQICLLESGQRKLTMNWLEKLSSALGCEPGAIVSRTPPFALVEREKLLVRTFRRLSETEQQRLLDNIVTSFERRADDALADRYARRRDAPPERASTVGIVPDDHWAAALIDVERRIRPLFPQKRLVGSVIQFLNCLRQDRRRNTGRARSRSVGDSRPWLQQAILGRNRWDSEALRDIVRQFVIETLADPEATLVVDETVFVRSGNGSCGVARQIDRSSGLVTNGQTGVFALYSTREGRAFIDRQLYLPASWTDDPPRMAAAHVPADIAYRSKAELALKMVEQAIAAGTPFSFITADWTFASDALEAVLRRAQRSYVLGIAPVADSSAGAAGRATNPPTGGAWPRLEHLVWRRYATADGRSSFEWAYQALPDFRGPDGDQANSSPRVRGVLIRRRRKGHEPVLFSTWCHPSTSLQTLISIQSKSGIIGEAFATAKAQFGLDHNATRSWHGWRRHVTLAMLAMAMDVAIRRRESAEESPIDDQLSIAAMGG
jgi:SRSO17 transposase/DNA-binding XRE family transcriptional regulator